MIGHLAARGAYFSFNGSFLEEERAAKRDAFRSVPLERLLVESDAPAMPLPRELDRYPLPDTSEGERVNHPANLVVAYEALARLRGMDLGELAAVVERNFRRLFARCRSGPAIP